jgi:hypothetical protein
VLESRLRLVAQPSMNGRTNAYVHAYAGSSGVMVDFLDGLNAVSSQKVTFVQGCESNQTSPDDPKGTFAAAKQAAAAADVTVLAVGLTLNVRWCCNRSRYIKRLELCDGPVLRTAFRAGLGSRGRRARDRDGRPHLPGAAAGALTKRIFPIDAAELAD